MCMLIEYYRQSKHISSWISWIVGIFTFFIFTIILHQYFPITADFPIFYHTAEGWREGTTILYDGSSPNFYNLPWTLFLFIPYTYLPLKIAQTIFIIMSLACIFATIHIVRQHTNFPLYTVILALLNLHIVDFLIRGQLDAIVLFGVGLGLYAIIAQSGWVLSFALLMMSIKPQNIILLTLLFFYGIRHWHLSKLIQVVSLPVLAIILSGFLVGFDWPLRWIQQYQTRPPLNFVKITIWRITEYWHIPSWIPIILAIIALITFAKLVYETGFNYNSFILAIATNIVFSTYAMGYHYILLIPVIMYVAYKNWKLGLVINLTGWFPFSRVIWHMEVVWLDFAYPVLSLLAAWYYVNRSPHP